MYLLIRLTTLLTLISFSFQICLDGCLSCADTTTCLLADSNEYFYLDVDTPKHSLVKGCESLLNDNNCYRCKPGFYKDDITNHCVVVDDDGIIEGCAYYIKPNLCSKCSPYKYLKTELVFHPDFTISWVTKCVPPFTPLVGCKYYAKVNQCSECDTGYILNNRTMTCVEDPKTPNCQAYSFIGCHACDELTMIDENLSYRHYLEYEKPANMNQLFYAHRAIKSNGPYNHPIQICKTSKGTCKDFNPSSDVCFECQKGYFLKDKQCFLSPEPEIPDCDEYFSLEVCEKCAPNHVFIHPNCAKVKESELVEHCIDYIYLNEKVVCDECIPSTYLQDNLCKVRVKSVEDGITGCVAVNEFEDNCITCLPELVLINEGSLCYQPRDNCQGHDNKLVNGILLCTKCSEEYYLVNEFDDQNQLTNTQCIKGDINDCAYYLNNDPLICFKCVNGFVLRDNSCFPSNSIQNCQTYSGVYERECEYCDPEIAVNVYLSNKCAFNTEPIPQCKSIIPGPNGRPYCVSCSRYYEVKDGICKRIPIDFCTKTNEDGTCVRCEEGLYLSLDRRHCVFGLSFYMQGCSTSLHDFESPIGILEGKCLSCTRDYYPYSVKDSFVCLSNMDINKVKVGFTYQKGCIRYDINMNCVQCDSEGSFPFLNPDSPYECFAKCEETNMNGSYYKVLLETENDEYEVKQWNVCKTTIEDDGCLEYVQNLDANDGSYVCVKCKDDQLTMVKRDDQAYTVFNAEKFSLFETVQSIMTKYPIVSCKAKALSVQSDNEKIDSVNNCKYYESIATDTDACLRCNYGYVGVPGTGSIRHIKECVLDSSCSEERLYNTGLSWKKLISCTKCVSDTEIPFIAYNRTSESDFNFNGFSSFTNTLNDQNTYSSTDSSLNNVFCKENTFNSFGLDELSYGVDSNCAIGLLFINSNGQTDYDNNKIGTTCIACKSGFKPVKHGETGFIKECVKIDNCEQGGDVLNTCKTCSDSFVFRYSNENIDFNNCVTIPEPQIRQIENCIAAEETNEGKWVCKLCKKGYMLDFVNYCEAIATPNCDKINYLFDNSIKKEQLDWGLFYKGQSKGCSKCKPDYFGVNLDYKSKICLYNSSISYVKGNDLFDGINTTLIEHCITYGANNQGDIGCTKCERNFMLRLLNDDEITGSECIAQTGGLLSRCAAFYGKRCKECETAFMKLIDGYCSTSFIRNCANVIVVEEETITLKCLECRSGFYVDIFDTCSRGAMTACEIYAFKRSDRCARCFIGHFLFPLPNGNNLCLPLDTSYKCDEISTTAENDKITVSCTNCVDSLNYLVQPLNDIENLTSCVHFEKISNCISFDVKESLAESSLRCTECKFPYYLTTNNKCQIRSNQSPHCISYEIDADLCLACDTGYSLRDEGIRCHPAPVGIPFCKKYEDFNVCRKCVPNKYLANNQCHDVLNKIDNCTHYFADGVCDECTFPYLLEGNECIKPNAEDCLTYLDRDTCSDCPSMHGLKIENGVTSCILIERPLCVEVSLIEPYLCLQCLTGSYNFGGRCLVGDVIEGCLVQKSTSLCESCQLGFVLNENSSECIEDNSLINTVENCDKQYLSETALCSFCKPGFKMKNGECVRLCTGFGKDGCFMCDLVEPDKCIICMTGYFNNNGECNPIAPCYVDNCKTCKEESKIECKECMFNFDLVLGKCENRCLGGQKENCKECSSIDRYKCVGCNDGYLLENLKCVRKCLPNEISNCLLCPGGQNNQCQKCNPRYFLKDGECFSNCKGVTRLNCSACDENDNEKCIVCNDGYYLEEGFCIKRCRNPELSNCLVCPESRTECLKCDTGYILSAARCEKIVFCKENCLFCDDQGNCKQCLEDYELDQGGCYTHLEKPCTSGLDCGKPPVDTDNTDSKDEESNEETGSLLHCFHLISLVVSFILVLH